VQQEEELGAEPKLGDFEDVHALAVSEARAVIKAVHNTRAKRPPQENPLGPDRIHNDSQYVNLGGQGIAMMLEATIWKRQAAD
jgi:DNA-directed RNA polymerase II subunit RPB4